jgi:hypothetical protein
MLVSWTDVEVTICPLEVSVYCVRSPQNSDLDLLRVARTTRAVDAEDGPVTN